MRGPPVQQLLCPIYIYIYMSAKSRGLCPPRSVFIHSRKIPAQPMRFE